MGCAKHEDAGTHFRSGEGNRFPAVGGGFDAVELEDVHGGGGRSPWPKFGMAAVVLALAVQRQ